MAKKRKARKSSGRRRVGRVKTDKVMDAVGVALGLVASQVVTTRFAASADPKIVAAAQVVGGILLAGKSKGLVSAAAQGIAASGILTAAKSFNLISGIGAPMVTFSRQNLSGADMPVINGRVSSAFAGMDEMSVISGAGGYN